MSEERSTAALAPTDRSQSAQLQELARAVDADLASPDHAPSTARAYTHDWADFVARCTRCGHTANAVDSSDALESNRVV